MPGVALLLALAVTASESARTAFFSYVGLIDCDGVAESRKQIYLACHSSGDQLPLRANGTEVAPGNGYAYVLRIDPERRKLIYATRIGGHGYTATFRVKLDNHGIAYVVGVTNAKDFPTTVGAVQRELGGNRDAFLVKLSPDGHVVYSTFLGGSGTDEGGRAPVAAHHS